MNSKQFSLLVLGLAVLALALLAVLVAAVDPFFRFHVPGSAEVYENERYQNPGMIRALDYDTVLMGTSLVSNFRASWFDELTGGKTIKISYRDGYYSDFDTALGLAFRTHPDIKTVYFGLDLSVLIRPDSQRTVELPAWLYDDNPFNDIEYFLNRDVFLYCLQTLRGRWKGTAQTLDESFVWAGDDEFSASLALANYDRPPESGILLPADTYFETADENLAVILGWAEAHPETEFELFFSPCSYLFWDKAEQEGTTQALFAVTRRAVETLLPCGNIRLHFFLGREQIILDLNNYCDYIHYSPTIARILSGWIIEDRFLLTPENYGQYLEHLEEVVLGYEFDYDYTTAYYWK